MLLRNRDVLKDAYQTIFNAIADPVATQTKLENSGATATVRDDNADVTEIVSVPSFIEQFEPSDLERC